MKNGILHLLIGSGLLATSAFGATTFSQFFNNGTGTGGDNLASAHNWNGAIGTAGADVTTIGNVGVSQGVTSTLGVPVVSGISTTAGFLFALPANNTSEASILYTTNLTSSNATPSTDPQSDWYSSTTDTLATVTLGDVTSLSFYARNGSTSPVMRLALLVGGTWYASTTSFQTTQTTNFEQFTLNSPGSINWYQGAFVAGTSLSADVTALTSVALNASSVIEGYGVYSDIGGLTAANSRVRIDSFEITAVPEPGAALLGGLGLLVLFRRRRNA